MVLIINLGENDINITPITIDYVNHLKNIMSLTLLIPKMWHRKTKLLSLWSYPSGKS